MKSLFKNVKSWVTGKQDNPVEDVQTPVLALTPTQVEEPMSAQTPVPVPAPKRVRREIVEEPERKPMEISSLYSGPEVKLISRGAKVYGVCPHCEAMWNVRERLTHPSFRRQESGKGLTCPACDKPVGLPANTDLRKLS